LGAEPPELLSLGASITQAGPDSLLYEGTLELSDGADDLEHQPAGRCAEIEVAAETDKHDAALDAKSGLFCPIEHGRLRLRGSG